MSTKKSNSKSVNLKTTWVMKDGKHILIKEMSNDHLCNTVKMLERLYSQRLDNIESFLRFGCLLQGEQAQMDFENCIDEFVEESFSLPIEDRFPSYPYLIKEAKRRKLL